MTTPQAARVRNLIRRIDLSGASPKKRAVVKLLTNQPLAKRIRFAGRCHCRGGQLLSYQLDGNTNRQRDDMEDCGYFCPSCGFSNAGARETYQPRRLRQEGEGR